MHHPCTADVKNCYGLSFEDYENIENLIEDIEPNEDSNNFPDFLFKKGFVEHFTVTSAEEKRKGSTHKIAENNFQKMNEKIGKIILKVLKSTIGTKHMVYF